MTTIIKAVNENENWYPGLSILVAPNLNDFLSIIKEPDTAYYCRYLLKDVLSAGLISKTNAHKLFLLIIQSDEQKWKVDSQLSFIASLLKQLLNLNIRVSQKTLKEFWDNKIKSHMLSDLGFVRKKI